MFRNFRNQLFFDKKFRENVFAKGIIEQLIWRNFFRWEYISQQSSVEIPEIYAQTFFGKNFVKTTFFLKLGIKYWIVDLTKYSSGESKLFIFPHCACILRLSSLKKNSSNRLFSTQCYLLSRNFAKRSEIRVNFIHFHTVFSTLRNALLMIFFKMSA